jgi:NAD(P)-dependent dehydrogenase (short-subunit alcohol dehydrogenase family)
MAGRLAGKAIVVAGAGGIGDELARRYASEGASIVIADLDGAGAERVAAEIRATGGVAIGSALQGDSDESVGAVVALALSEFGGLDGFHANYASFADSDSAQSDVLGIDMDVYDEVMRINARGFVLCTRHALPPMLARGGGSIVYTSSGAAYIGEPLRLAYAMSKLSLHALMRHVARLFGPRGIRANVIAPGVISHPRSEAALSPEVKEEFRRATLFGDRLGAPRDIAAMGALLMADEGAFITGQVLSVDGGNVMRP